MELEVVRVGLRALSLASRASSKQLMLDLAGPYREPLAMFKRRAERDGVGLGAPQFRVGTLGWPSLA